MSTLDESKELEILREAVDKAENKNKSRVILSESVKNIITIVEDYITRHQLICYGGTAINNVLPIDDQFYDREVEIPDYDVFSKDPMEDAKNLANLYYQNKYTDVEAKTGVHEGTYKVYVNSIPVADITFLVPEIFDNIIKTSIKVNGILYAPPNFLRMSMYLELSRPDGDVTRWEKILKRLILLNKHFPIKGHKCDSLNFIRSFETGTEEEVQDIYSTVKQTLINQGVVFFGGFAATLYGKYMPRHQRKQLKHNADFDVLSSNPEMTATIIKERLDEKNYKDINIVKHNSIGEIIPEHYQIFVGEETVGIIYQTTACHSYNKIKIGENIIRIATIDTMLSFFLAFIYVDRPYYDHERILCMAQYLFIVQSKNRLKQTGLLKRFSISCYGYQQTFADLRNERLKKFKALKKNMNKEEYNKLFFKYKPDLEAVTKSKKPSNKKNKTLKNKSKEKTDNKKPAKKAKKKAAKKVDKKANKKVAKKANKKQTGGANEVDPVDVDEVDPVDVDDPVDQIGGDSDDREIPMIIGGNW